MRLGAGWPALAGLVAAAAGLGAPSGAKAAAAPVVRPTQELVTLVTPHAILAFPDDDSPRTGSVPVFRPITGGATVLPVVGQAEGWLRVGLPGRPNGHTGWIAQRRTVRSTTGWHVVVRTSSRRVHAYHRGRRVRSFTAIVGRPSTPTPHGTFFVEESVRMRPGSAGTPFALALSARSNVLQEFAGGPGQIAIHGVGNIGGALGTAVSHGCVRLGDRAIRWLAARISPGAPVTIRP